MAISATFSADFSDFQSAVSKAEVSLKSFEAGAGKVGTSLDKMSNSLSGTKMIQDATLMAEAVERVGGVSKLTEAELAKVSAQAKEAAAKLQALGQDVPPGIQKIADATKNATDQTKVWKDAITSTAGAFGLAFSVGGVIAFGKSVFDSASKIHDLAEQMGISTDAVQGFKFASEQAGSSLDTVNTAITKMNANLDGGEKATVDALKKAGLSFQEIRSMKPEDAFLAITDAIQKIPDPMTQSEVALKLFGKSAGELLPAIKEGFRGAADGASKMSEDTIKSLEAAQDAWEKLGNKVTIVSGNIIAKSMSAFETATTGVTRFFLAADAWWSGSSEKIGLYKLALDGLPPASAAAGAGITKVGGVVHKTAEELAAAAAASKRHAEELAAVAERYNGMAKQIKLLAENMKTMKPGDDWKGLAEDLGKLSQQGAKLTPEMTQLAISFGTLMPAAKMGADGITGLGFAVEVAIPKLSEFNQAILDLQKVTIRGMAGVPEMGFKIGTGFEEAGAKMKKAADDSKKAWDGMIQSLTQLATVAGNTFGEIGREIATFLTSVNAVAKGIEQVKEGQATATKGGGALATIGGIAAMASGYGAIAIGAIAAGKAIAKLFDTKGRDAVKDFASSMGGFDALHVKLNELGADGEKLWIALTQGVGKNNPEQAKAAIEAITAALDAQKSKAGEAAAAAAAEAQAQVQAQQQALDAITERYAGTISKLESEYKSLNDSVSQEAEEAVMGVVETQQRERMKQIEAEKAAQEAMRDAEIAAKQMTFEQWVKDGQKTRDDLDGIFGKPLEIPYSFVPTNGPGDGGGRTYTPPKGGGGAGATTFEVPVYLDGREVGRGMIRHMPGLLTTAGL